MRKDGLENCTYRTHQMKGKQRLLDKIYQFEEGMDHKEASIVDPKSNKEKREAMEGHNPSPSEGTRLRKR